MQTLANDNTETAPLAARIFLHGWPRSYECGVAFLDQRRAIVATNLARDLPNEFSLAVAPDFELRHCAVTWRGKQLVRVLLLPEEGDAPPTSVGRRTLLSRA